MGVEEICGRGKVHGKALHFFQAITCFSNETAEIIVLILTVLNALLYVDRSAIISDRLNSDHSNWRGKSYSKRKRKY